MSSDTISSSNSSSSTEAENLLDQNGPSNPDEIMTNNTKCSKRKKSLKEPSSDEIISQIHYSLWPKNDLELFRNLLAQNPRAIVSKFGPCKDTLLHR